MPAGDCVVLREATAGETSNSLSYTDYEWDTEVYRDASSFSLSGSTGVTCLNAGPKLVVYNNSYLGTGSNRSELRNRIEIDGTRTLHGQTTGYIRRSGDSYSSQCGIGIIETGSPNQVVSIARARTDSNTGAPCTRQANECGFSIVELDDSWAYFRGIDNISQSLTHASGETPPVTAASYEWQDVLVRIEQRKDTGFLHSTTVNPAEITLDGGRRYLICYSVKFNNPSGSVRVNGLTRLVYDGVHVPASLATAYARGSNGCQEPVACGAVIFSPTGRNKALKLQAAPGQEGAGTMALNEVAISIVDLGTSVTSGVDVAVLRQSADHDHNVARTSFDPITWDTQDVLDTDSFGHSTVTNSERLESLNGGRIFAFSSFFHLRTAVNTTRKRPRVKFRRYDSDLDAHTAYDYGLGDNFNRGDQSTTSTWTAGGVAGGVFELPAGDFLEAGGCDPASTADSSTAWAAEDCALFAIDLSTMGAVAPADETATLAIEAPLLVVSATATSADPPSETATLALGAPLPTMALAASSSPPASETAVVALAAPLPTVAIAASSAEPPSASATFAVDAPLPALEASATVSGPPTYTASLGATAPLPQVSASASVTAPGGETASLAIAAPLPSLEVSASTAPPPSYTATLAASAPLPVVGLAASSSSAPSSTATLALSAPLPVVELSAAPAAAPSETASFAVSAPLPLVGLALESQGPWTGSVDATVPLPQVQFPATVWEPVGGTLEASAPLPVVSLEASRGAPPSYTASLAASVPLPEIDLAAAPTIPGSAELAIVVPLPIVALRPPLLEVQRGRAQYVLDAPSAAHYQPQAAASATYEPRRDAAARYAPNQPGGALYSPGAAGEAST